MPSAYAAKPGRVKRSGSVQSWKTETGGMCYQPHHAVPRPVKLDTATIVRAFRSYLDDRS